MTICIVPIPMCGGKKLSAITTQNLVGLAKYFERAHEWKVFLENLLHEIPDKLE
jgi:hypothetical protein